MLNRKSSAIKLRTPHSPVVTCKLTERPVNMKLTEKQIEEIADNLGLLDEMFL